MSETKYIDAAEVAKLIRLALKESFPGVKFSVKTDKYAGGASIDIAWTDGPTGEMVDSTVKPWAGAYFDGMQDYQGSRYHTLDGKPVYMGAKFIFTHRAYSPAVIQVALDKMTAAYGLDPATTDDYQNGQLYARRLYPEPHWCREDLQTITRRELGKTNLWDRAEPCDSATRKRVVFTGDDGYWRTGMIDPPPAGTTTHPV